MFLAGNLPVAIPARGITTSRASSSARERLSGAGCRVAHQLLQELGLKYGCGIQDAADQNHEETTDSEVLVLEQPQIHDGILSPPLPPDQAGHTRNEQEAEDADEGGGKPVVLFALIEHDLHAAHGDRQQSEADVVQFPEIGTICFDPGRILDQAADQKEREYADGQIDVEDPSPGVVVGDPTADRRPEGWRKHCHKTVEREGLATLLFFEGIRHDGLRHRLEAATSDALKYTRNEQDRERWGDTAKKTCRGEDGDA